MGIFSPEGKLAGVLNRLGTLMVLNGLTILCALPLVTLGPALSALFTCTLKLARGEAVSPIKNYFAAFRENFLQSNLLGLAMLGCTGLIGLDIRLLNGLDGSPVRIYQTILLILAVLAALVFLYALAISTRYHNSLKNHVKNAAILIVIQPVSALSVLAVWLLPLILPLISARFVSILILVGISGPAYLSSIRLNDLFQRFLRASQ